MGEPAGPAGSGRIRGIAPSSAGSPWPIALAFFVLQRFHSLVLAGARTPATFLGANLRDITSSAAHSPRERNKPREVYKANTVNAGER